MLLGPLLPDDWPDMLARLMRGEQIEQFDSSQGERSLRDGSGAGGTVSDVSITISPVRAADGSMVGGSLVARDVSARKAAERRTSVVLGELDHRVKNILAVVSAVVSQTLKARPEPEQFAIELQGRVKAIANAHSLLTRNGQDEVSMQAIIAAELAAFDRGDGRLVVTGPDVALTPKAGLALALAVHELASNAAKYGALSTEGGRLSVTSTISRDEATPRLTLVWAEAGGPPVQPPSRRGFGTTLINRSLSYELDAEVKRDFLPEGVRCTIVVPLTYEVGR
jgi:two-component system CheB/CheR fusion protein